MFSEGTQTRALHTPRGRTTTPPRSRGAESASDIRARMLADARRALSGGARVSSEWSGIPLLRLLGIRGMPLTVPSSAGSGGSFPASRGMVQRDL